MFNIYEVTALFIAEKFQNTSNDLRADIQKFQPYDLPDMAEKKAGLDGDRNEKGNAK